MAEYDLLIIGGGPAGLTAALYACRAGLQTLLIEKGTFGGQVTTTEIVENYPGFPQGVSGFELMLSFQEQATRFGCTFLTAEVEALKAKDGIWQVRTTEREIRGKAVILATGAQPRSLGVPGEKELQGRGVSYCAACDGFFYRDKKIAVVGGGDAAVKEALALAKIVKEIILIHRRAVLRADQVLVEQALATPQIKICWETVVTAMQGTTKLDALVVQNVKTGEKQEIAVDGVFLYVGIQPQTKFLGKEFAQDEAGYLLTTENLQTTLPGVFAIGDCRQKACRQVATAVGDGALVVTAVQDYLMNL